MAIGFQHKVLIDCIVNSKTTALDLLLTACEMNLISIQ